MNEWTFDPPTQVIISMNYWYNSIPSVCSLQQTWSDKMITRIRNVIKIANKKARLSGKQPEAHSPVKKKKMSSKDELIRRYPVQSNASLSNEDPESLESHKKAIEDELTKAKPRDTVLLPLLKLTYSERRMYIQEVASSVTDILTNYKALSRPTVVSCLHISLVALFPSFLKTTLHCLIVYVKMGVTQTIVTNTVVAFSVLHCLCKLPEQVPG